MKSRLLALEESSLLIEMENRELRARMAILEKGKGPGFEKWAKGQLENLGARVPALEGRYEIFKRRVGMVEKRIDAVYGVVKGIEARVRGGSNGGVAPPSIPPPPPGLGMGPIDLPAVLRDIAVIQALWASGLKEKAEDDMDERVEKQGQSEEGSVKMDLDTDEE